MEGEPTKFLYIVIGGEFESFHKQRDSLRVRLPEASYLPRQERVVIMSKGTVVGDEDILNREKYSNTVKCTSQQGQLYQMAKENFRYFFQFEKMKTQFLHNVVVKEQKCIFTHINVPEFTIKQKKPTTAET